MSETATFVDAVLQGRALPDDIDDYIEAWHDTPGAPDSVSQFLGLTAAEYALWVEHPQSLRFVFAARKHHRSVAEIRDVATAAAAAARAENDDEAKKLLAWLKQTGRYEPTDRS
ncbi:hypothetical protein [Kribbella sp. NPDC000426]|uniref:hypothetical protein n=1 Tax=Kribbella sp. NPDC000426 TaxID=3154255 RepID=UPI00332D6B36